MREREGSGACQAGLALLGDRIGFGVASRCSGGALCGLPTCMLAGTACCADALPAGLFVLPITSCLLSHLS